MKKINEKLSFGADCKLQKQVLNEKQYSHLIPLVNMKRDKMVLLLYGVQF